MSALFDTLKYSQRLERAGFPHDEAVALSEAQADSLKELMEVRITITDMELALTPLRGDLLIVQSDIKTLKTDVKTIQGDLHLVAKHLAVLNLGIGLLVAMAVSVVVKTFIG